jgi:hypothetical protein
MIDMATRRRRRDYGDPAERVRLLLEQLWKGDRRLMADQTRTPVSVIRDIARGKDVPGAVVERVLYGCKHQSRVDRRWLETGRGSWQRQGGADGGESDDPEAPETLVEADLGTRAGRVVWCAGRLWHGHLGRMAEDTGIGTGRLHDICLEGAEPTDDELLAILGVPGCPVRLEWIVEGQGGPFAGAEPTAPAEGAAPQEDTPAAGEAAAGPEAGPEPEAAEGPARVPAGEIVDDSGQTLQEWMDRSHADFREAMRKAHEHWSQAARDLAAAVNRDISKEVRGIKAAIQAERDEAVLKALEEAAAGPLKGLAALHDLPEKLAAAKGRILALEHRIDDAIGRIDVAHRGVTMVGARADKARDEIAFVAGRAGDALGKADKALGRLDTISLAQEQLSRRIDDLGRKLDDLAGAGRSVAADAGTRCNGLAERLDALEGRHAVPGPRDGPAGPEGWDRMLDELERRLEARRAARGEAPARPNRRRLPEAEADLDPEDILTLDRWLGLPGPYQRFLRDGGDRKTAGRRLMAAYREHGIRIGDGPSPSGHSPGYKVADLRHYVGWLAAAGLEPDLDSWLAYFREHALPEWAARGREAPVDA